MNPMYRDLNLKDYIKSNKIRLSSTDNDFPFDGIWCYTGFQGSGKTLNLVHTLMTIKRLYPDCRIISNITLWGIDYEPYKGLESFNSSNGSKGIIYVIDEIQSLYCSLESAKVPVSMVSVWSQNRKNRRVILCTSQRFGRISKPIREQCKYHIECKKPLLGFFRYRVIDAYLYDEDGKLPLDYSPPRFSLYVPKKEYFSVYDTKEVVKNG